MREVGDFIKIRRKQLGFTQKELSILSGVDYETLRKIETNSTTKPGFYTVHKLFAALKVDFVEIVNWARKYSK